MTGQMSKQVHIVGPSFSYSSLITIGVFLIALSLSIFADTVQSDEMQRLTKQL